MLFRAICKVNVSLSIGPSVELGPIICVSLNLVHFRAIHAGLIAVKDLLRRLFGRLWAYGLVGLSFILFLIFNGGIVVGDKAAHVSVFHLPQVIIL